MKDYHDESYRTRTFTHLHTKHTHSFTSFSYNNLEIKFYIKVICLFNILHFVSNKMDMNEERRVLFICSNPYNFEYLKIKMSYRGFYQ